MKEILSHFKFCRICLDDLDKYFPKAKDSPAWLFKNAWFQEQGLQILLVADPSFFPALPLTGALHHTGVISYVHVTCCYSVNKLCLTLCNPMGSTLGFPVLHHLLEFAQTHVHWLSDIIQPSHPQLPPSSAFSLSQHQGLYRQLTARAHHKNKNSVFKKES